MNKLGTFRIFPQDMGGFCLFLEGSVALLCVHGGTPCLISPTSKHEHGNPTYETRKPLDKGFLMDVSFG